MTGITFEQQLQFLNKSSLAVGEIMITWFSDFPEYQYLQLWANYGYQNWTAGMAFVEESIVYSFLIGGNLFIMSSRGFERCLYLQLWID